MSDPREWTDGDWMDFSLRFSDSLEQNELATEAIEIIIEDANNGNWENTTGDNTNDQGHTQH